MILCASLVYASTTRDTVRCTCLCVKLVRSPPTRTRYIATLLSGYGTLLTVALVQSAGMCYECKRDCHANHETFSIGKKRNFRCDCGTDKYPGVPCLLRAGKESNDRNVYTHNFDLRYCFCDQHARLPVCFSWCYAC